MTVVRIVQANVPLEYWDDPARGSIAFQTLLSSDITPTHSLVCGIAIMKAGDTFALHSHPQPEVYFGLDGAGEVYINGEMHTLSAGVTLFIPGGAVHGVPRASRDLRWFYTFATDRFDQVDYSFLQTRG